MEQKIEQQKNRSTLEYIMHYGALLGFFWIFRYLFKIGESYWEHFIWVYAILNIVSPLLMYVFYIRYMMQTPERRHGFWSCVLFIIGICFFGSFFEAALMYAHFTFINPDVFANISASMMGLTEGMMRSIEESGALKNLSVEELAAMKSQMEAVAGSKFPYIISFMINQVITGFIFSLLIGLFTRNRKINPNQ